MFDIKIQRFDSGGHVDACLISPIDSCFETHPTQTSEQQQCRDHCEPTINRPSMCDYRFLFKPYPHSDFRWFRSLVARKFSDYPVEAVRDINSLFLVPPFVHLVGTPTI